MLGLKLNHVSKSGPSRCYRALVRTILLLHMINIIPISRFRISILDIKFYFDELVQERRNSRALVMESRFFCTNLSIYTLIFLHYACRYFELSTLNTHIFQVSFHSLCKIPSIQRLNRPVEKYSMCHKCSHVFKKPANIWTIGELSYNWFR